MIVKLFFITLALTAAGAFSGCMADVKGVPVDHASACSTENDKKVVEVTGYLEPRAFMYCSNRGGRMECGFDLKDTPESDKIVRVDLEEGTSANMVEKLEKGFKKEDVKIHDNTGAVIRLSNKVRATGKISIVPPAGNSEGVCFMQVTRIER
jgi:hypothetical protein